MTEDVFMQAVRCTTEAQESAHMLVARYRLPQSVNMPETQLSVPVRE